MRNFRTSKSKVKYYHDINVETKKWEVIELPSRRIIKVYKNFLKSSTDFGLYFKLNAIAGNNSVIDALRVVSTLSERICLTFSS